MLSYINKYHRNYKKEAEIQKKRVESVYQYRFKSELAELSKINKRRSELFDSVAIYECTHQERMEYRRINERKLELDDLLKAGKEQIIIEVGNKF